MTPTATLTIKSRIRSLLDHFVAHVRRHGVGQTLRRTRRAIATRCREAYLGIDTDGSIGGELLGHDEASFGYQPIPYESFDAAISALGPIGPDMAFLDYGCGKGRAVVLAARRPFKRVIGVERSSELSDVARHNIARAGRRLACDDVTIVTADARDYVVPVDVSTVFLFNPFDEPILRAVLQRIRESLDEQPRPMAIIYGLPKCRDDVLLSIDWLRLKCELDTIDSDWQRLGIYEAG